MAGENNENKDDEIIDVIVEGEDHEDSPETDEDNKTESEDSDSDAGDDESGDSTSDEHGEETDAEREAIRERRRQERHERKQRLREREDTLRREIQSRDTVINEMRSRLDAIDRRNSGTELAQIDNAKKEAVRRYNYFKDQIRIGTESNNGTLVAEATEKMLLARQGFSELELLEKQVKQRKQQPQPLDPRIADNAREWTERNSWYNPKSNSLDSRITLTIDQALAEEGWDPTTKEYWEELDARIKKHLPHRATRATVPSRPKNVVTGSGGERTGSNKGAFRLSKERVQAIKDMGAWDDPVARNKLIKQYRDYDKANEGAR